MMKFIKSKKGKITMGILFVLIILYVVFKGDIDAYFKRMFQGKVSNDLGTGNESKLLKKGSRGNEVVLLQRGLMDNGFDLPKYKDDGIFGAETETALLAATGQKAITLSDFYAKFPVNTGVAGNIPTKEISTATAAATSTVQSVEQVGDNAVVVKMTGNREEVIPLREDIGSAQVAV